jgi:hypothetical protein
MRPHLHWVLAPGIFTQITCFPGELLDVTIALFFDERSMISQKLLGAAENNISKTAHGFGHSHEDRGGVLIIIIFRDDYQLPSIEAGALDCFNASRITKLGAQLNGKEQLKKLSQKVMYLQRSMRQKKSEKIFLRLLSQKLLGAAENNISKTAHGFGHSHEDWGGVPIIIIF